jgi:hypothetical protein
MLLFDLRRQLGSTRRFRGPTERAIRQIEIELAGGRELAGKAATEREKVPI